MATIQFKKGDAYLAKLSALERMTRKEVCGSAIYGAADIVTDEIRSALDKIPTDEGYGTQSEPTEGPKIGQVKALKATLGIASMQDDGTGFLNVKIGWDGYNHIKTKNWPGGEPNQMVARSIERGTSFMKANPFVKPTMAKVRKRAIAFMKEAADKAIEQQMKGK